MRPLSSMRSAQPLGTRGALPGAGRVALGLFAALSLASCDEQKLDVTRVYPAPRLAALAPIGGTTLRFDATSTGRVEFSLESKEARVRGSLPLIRGWLSVDVENLHSLRGNVQFDATRLELAETAAGIDLDTAKGLLELSQAAPLNDTASFSITRVVSTTRNTAASEPEGGEEGEAARSAVVRVQGDLELHGRRAQREVSLALAFSAAADGTPARVRVRAEDPLRLELAPFAIRAPLDRPELKRLLLRAKVEFDLGFIARP